ncbi:MAG: hypothetical protein NT067_05280 [Candidatus Diapherotrites archaeon]|nr:hypothetical protein [Candidatus Diapherotrites archaeon]
MPQPNKSRLQFRPEKLRTGHGRLRTRDRELTLPSGKTMVVRGKDPERFIERALRLGIGSERLLKNFTKLSHYTVRQIKRDLQERNLMPEKTWRQRRIDAMSESGEWGARETAIETRAERRSIITMRSRLARQGRLPVLRGTKAPAMKAIRALITFQAVKEITGRNAAYCDRIAQKETKDFSWKRWQHYNPGILEDAIMLGNGEYWNRAIEQMLAGKGKAKLRGPKAKKAIMGIKAQAIEVKVRVKRLGEELQRQAEERRVFLREQVLGLKTKIAELDSERMDPRNRKLRLEEIEKAKAQMREALVGLAGGKEARAKQLRRQIETLESAIRELTERKELARTENPEKILELKGRIVRARDRKWLAGQELHELEKG